MGCFVVAEFLLTSALRSPSAIAEPLVVCATVNFKKFSYCMLLAGINKTDDVFV